MNLVQVTNESIVIGQPLPFSLRDEAGILLARKGYVIGSRADLEAMRGRGPAFYVDVSESEKHQKAFVSKLMELVADAEDRFRVTIPNEILTELVTVDDVARAIHRLQGA